MSQQPARMSSYFAVWLWWSSARPRCRISADIVNAAWIITKMAAIVQWIACFRALVLSWCYFDVVAVAVVAVVGVVVCVAVAMCDSFKVHACYSLVSVCFDWVFYIRINKIARHECMHWTWIMHGAVRKKQPQQRQKQQQYPKNTTKTTTTTDKGVGTTRIVITCACVPFYFLARRRSYSVACFCSTVRI